MGATTRGLALFGLAEIDYPPSGEEPAAIYTRLLNLAAYVLANGPVLRDGDSIGTGAGAQVRVQHARDAGGRPLLVVTRAAAA